eukprot:TRINITY_DN12100_c0_g1_i11.p6 TRINITY_DN12100_c0_g1~~TRINITY_DN12100_c0_g1_i11.p6  ORF type:complete len:136 (+),score=35.31 TRINITY_DN12100_c0_g1_i11:3556-3963(+)
MAASNTTMLVGGSVAAAFLAYCVYFDYKRRNAPDYKDKLRQKRAEQAKEKARQAGSDPEALKAFFQNSMAKGQELQATNPQEAAVHYANAISVYGNPAGLVAMLKRTLAPEVFLLVMSRLQQMQQQVQQQQAAAQ